MGQKGWMILSITLGSTLVVVLILFGVNCGAEVELRKRVESLESSRGQIKIWKPAQDIFNQTILDSDRLIIQRLMNLESINHANTRRRQSNPDKSPKRDTSNISPTDSGQ